MGLIDNVIDALKFKDTIFYKTDSDLQIKYEALKKLNEEYPLNENLKNELYMVKKGLDGENEIAYQLQKANIGMYVLRDIKVKYGDLTAQIDYVIITPLYIYYVECKNLIGNITVTEKGDFIREYVINGKRIKKGMYSPLRQVEAQREIMRKIWESNTSKIKKVLASKYFEHYRRTLVVVANQDTILNTNKAPKEIKYKILKADALVRQIKYDLDHRDKEEYLSSKKNMEGTARSYVNIAINDNIDYYDFYKNKYCNLKVVSNDNLRDRLIKFRKNRALNLKIPAYYIFNNEELEQLLNIKPKSIEELKNILAPIKVKNHGQMILEEMDKDKE